mmetsp:Transcript_1835/g.3692  ORF Transcript_1835/g.3692 Transcript_1835/m.3692 type:complete len:351 (-) Transcript_1835:88-1140(-)
MRNLSSTRSILPSPPAPLSPTLPRDRSNSSSAVCGFLAMARAMAVHPSSPSTVPAWSSSVFRRLGGWPVRKSALSLWLLTKPLAMPFAPWSPIPFMPSSKRSSMQDSLPRASPRAFAPASPTLHRVSRRSRRLDPFPRTPAASAMAPSVSRSLKLRTRTSRTGLPATALATSPHPSLPMALLAKCSSTSLLFWWPRPGESRASAARARLKASASAEAPSSPMSLLERCTTGMRTRRGASAVSPASPMELRCSLRTSSVGAPGSLRAAARASAFPSPILVFERSSVVHSAGRLCSAIPPFFIPQTRFASVQLFKFGAGIGSGCKRDSKAHDGGLANNVRTTTRKWSCDILP